MHLARIKGENFRLFEKLDFNPHPRVTFITGENAAGKTSLLESIYCLGRAKSFRGNGPAELAGAGGRHWQVMARLQQADLPSTTVKVAWNPEGTSVHFGEGGRPTAAELVSQLPTQIIEPAMHRLLQDGPGYRRSFLDWGVFHVEHRFFPVWRRHQRRSDGALQGCGRSGQCKRHPGDSGRSRGQYRRHCDRWQDAADARQLLRRHPG